MFVSSSLNTAQREAVNQLEGPVMILAGAGTGKTRTVTCRIAALLDHGVSPENILAVTFTNKASAEMRERISEMVGKKQAKAMTVATFHSLCVKLLRNDIDKLDYNKNFSICTANDQTGLIKEFIVRKGGADVGLKPSDVLWEISKKKNAGLPLDTIEDPLIREIASVYSHELKLRNAVDFDDLLLLGERLLREHAPVRMYWQSQFKYITVDEFQDTNSLQMRLLQLLVDEKQNVCVVGDDDQSIYGWRGAEVANILEFERFFKDPRIIRLEENYRSSESILHSANSLIKHNAGRREKELKPVKVGGEMVQVISMPGDEEEAEYVAEEIFSLKAQLNRPYEDWAILFRTNVQIRKMEQALRSLKIPYRMVGAQSFFDRREVRDVMAYLQVLSYPGSDVPMLRILNTPPRGIGSAVITTALEFSREHQCSIWLTLQNSDFRSKLSTRMQNAVEAFTFLIEKYRALIKSNTATLPQILNQLLDEIGYTDWLHRQCKNESERTQRDEGIFEVMASLTTLSKQGKSLQEFMDEMSLASEREDNDDLEKKKGVTLITLHASKGLEFPLVYLVGLEQGILPHQRSLEEHTVDEERRLLYVGMTRAQDRLTMTYCAYRIKYKEKVACLPSTFLKEIDTKFIDTSSYDDLMGQEASDEELANFLGNMKEMLN